MIVPIREIASVLVIIVLVGVRCAQAQTGEPLRGPSATAIQSDAGLADPVVSVKAASPAVQPAAPQVNTAEATGRANKDVGADIDATLAGWQHELDRVEGELRQPRLRYSQLNGLRDALQRLRSSVEGFSDRLQPRLSAAKAQMDQLGPGPAAGQPPESEQVARNRAELSFYIGLLGAGEAAVKAAQTRIDQLIDGVQEVRRKNFSSSLFQPVPGVYALETWTQLPSVVPGAISRLRDLVSDWWTGVHDTDDVKRMALEAAVLAVALLALAWFGVPRLRRWPAEGEPPFWKRASSTAGVILLRAATGIAPIALLYVLVAEAQALPDRLDWLLYASAQSWIIAFAVSAMVVTVFAPAAPRWRLVPASDQAAWRICGLVVLLAIVYGLTTLIYVATRVVQAPFALTVAVAVPSCLLLAGIVVTILFTPLEGRHRDGVTSPRWLKALRVPVWAVIAAIVVTTLSGYLSLARFLAQQLVVTGSVLALVYLLLLCVDGFTQGLADENAATGRWLGTRAGLGQRRREQLALPVGLFLKLVVLVLSVPLIMLQWGYNWPDIWDWYRQLFFGLHIANTQVTFAALLASVIVFVLAYAASRLFQGWLDARVLQPAGISGGVRDSIRTGVGYAGVIIAAVVAFSYAGFNLSSLAIVAGALSVGVGLGLQGVVNNFVSGLILLVERPIKVGDIVVVGGEEGTIRKISVRSTVIETADRGHVLVPNSYFITEKVKNWTHRDHCGRVAIAVSVATNSNPRQTRDILLKVAKDHSEVLAEPAPFVEFEEFGADSLNFRLYAHTRDLTRNASVRTDLRIAILDAFKHAGVSIAFLQADTTMRSIERLGAAVSQYVSIASNGHGDDNGFAAPRGVGEAGG